MIGKSCLVGHFNDDILKRYKFIAELGKGTYGSVYRIEDKITGEIRACKKVDKKQIKRKDRFKNEIILLKVTDHQNIIKLFDIYEDNFYVYLVMEECQGGELFEVLRERARNSNFYTEREAAGIFKQILSAIVYCHNSGICHRDLKPENILFVYNEQYKYVKLIDFGLSKLFSPSNNNMNSIVGTIYYMSPEVILGTYNEKCDVWSAGVILYIMLCGRPPFFGKTSSEITQKILQIKYDFSGDAWQKVSLESIDLLSRIFVDADKRLSAQEVLNHNWVSHLALNSNEELLIKFNFDHILKYIQLNKIQKSFIFYICYKFKYNQTQELTEIFKSLDKNSDGVLTIEEFRDGLEILNSQRDLQITEAQLDSIFAGIDLDKSGTINYNEFIASTFDISKEVKLEHVYEAFKSFDADKSGKISLREISEIIKPFSEDDIDYLNDLMYTFDLNGDGEIDFQEFLLCLGIPLPDKEIFFNDEMTQGEVDVCYSYKKKEFCHQDQKFNEMSDFITEKNNQQMWNNCYNNNNATNNNNNNFSNNNYYQAEVYGNVNMPEFTYGNINNNIPYSNNIKNFVHSSYSLNKKKTHNKPPAYTPYKKCNTQNFPNANYN